MIELPEALVIARQMDKELAGKRIVHGDRGNSPHKFAFSSGTSEEYAAIFKGKTVGRSTSHGMATCTEVGSDHTLVLGGGGERILLHPQGAKLPKKYQLLLQFEDGMSLTVTVSGWGNTLLLPQETAGQHRHVREDRIVPLSDAFTWDYFRGLFRDAGESIKSIKYFVISEPGIHGIGNGCLQDIHWAHGIFGYFPTYALGNLYAAQFWRQILSDIPDLLERFTRGEFGQLLVWLRERIHSQGSKYTAADLCQRVTGQLIPQQERRVVCQRDSQRHSLLFPAREAVGAEVGPLGQTDHLQ